MQLKVVKADGIEEGYLHTKVIASIVNAFAEPAQETSSVAGELAEAVTFYLYSKYGKDKVTSSEILSIIQAVLSSTGYGHAAANLAEHHGKRSLLRTRVEVLKSNIREIPDAVKSRQDVAMQPVNHWNKSKIVNDLIAEYNLDITMARTIASIVEEKILASGFRTVPSGFIKFLTIQQTQAMLSAQQQLKFEPDENTLNSVNNASTDGCLRQPQKGLCTVEI